MKAILLKNRLKLFIFLTLLAVLAGSFLSMASPYLLAEFKSYIQKKTSENFKVDLEIGEISGGFIRPLEFKNVRLLKKDGGRVKFSFEVNILFANYRIWDLAIAQFFGYKQLVIIISRGGLCLNSQEAVFSQINGQVILDGEDLERINLIAKCKTDTVTLSGQVKKEAQSFRLDLRLTFINKFIQANFHADGFLDELKLKGRVSLSNANEIKLQSLALIKPQTVEFKNVDINCGCFGEIVYNFKEGWLSAKFFSPEEKEKFFTVDLNLADQGYFDTENFNNFLLKLNFNHFNISGCDIVSFIEAKGRLGRDEGQKRRFIAEIMSYGSILNHYPADELEIFCDYEEGVLHIVSAQLGEEHLCSGNIDFRSQSPEIDLVWHINQMAISDFVSFFNKDSDTDLPFRGSLDGQICLQGSLFEPLIKAALKSKQGNFFNIAFESANVNLDGKFPVLIFHDSRIYREGGGFFVLDGKLDLKKIGEYSFWQGFKILSDEKTVVLDGWDISRGADRSEINLKKAVSDDLKVGFKAFVNDRVKNNPEDAEAFEVEYKLQDNRSLLMRLDKKDEFFGVEQKVEF